MRVGSRLCINDIGTEGTTYPPFPQYYGRLVDTDYVGSIGKNRRTTFRLRFEIEETKVNIGWND